MFLKNNAYICEGCYVHITRNDVRAGRGLDYIIQKHEENYTNIGNKKKTRRFMIGV